MSQNKYFFVFLLIVLSMVSADVVMSIPVSDTDNKHNLSSSATHGGPHAQPVSTGGTDQICIFCHTPHSATPDSTLWSRPDPNSSTFKLYGGQLVIKGDLPGSPANSVDHSKYQLAGPDPYPSGSSRLCLSCHDGVTAIGLLNIGTPIAMVSGQEVVTGSAMINLETSHPISFVYDTDVLADIVSVRGDTYQLPLNLTVFTPLDGANKMQCTTCHDPHEDTKADGYSVPFWRHRGTPIVNPYEDVCNQCHIGGTPGFPAGDHNPGPGI